MGPLRITPSLVDNFRFYRRLIEERGGDWSGFIDDITHDRDSAGMRVGRAWHALLGRMGGADLRWNGEDHAPAGEREEETVRFVLPVDGLEITQPDDWEVPVVETVETDAGRVILSGRLDGVAADVGVEFKTTGRAINLEKYLDAYQWRCYLFLCPWLEKVRYEVVQLRERRRRRGDEGGMPVYDVAAHRSVDAPRYDTLDSDVRWEVGDLARALRLWAGEGLIRIGEDGRVVREAAE